MPSVNVSILIYLQRIFVFCQPMPLSSKDRGSHTHSTSESLESHGSLRRLAVFTHTKEFTNRPAPKIYLAHSLPTRIIYTARSRGHTLGPQETLRHTGGSGSRLIGSSLWTRPLPAPGGSHLDHSFRTAHMPCSKRLALHPAKTSASGSNESTRTEPSNWLHLLKLGDPIGDKSGLGDADCVVGLSRPSIRGTDTCASSRGGA